MTKYYVGYEQGTGEYVYVSELSYVSNVRVTTFIEGALGFTTVELAQAMLNIVNTLVSNQEYKVLQIETNITEVE